MITSDAHEGLKAAIAQVLSGASWQRCWVHFMRNILAHVTQRDKAMVVTAPRIIHAQADQEATRKQLRAVYDAMQSRRLKAVQIQREAEDDIGLYEFPNGALEADLFQQCARTVAQGGPTKDQCRGCLPG